jgi:hypothetical protein
MVARVHHSSHRITPVMGPTLWERADRSIRIQASVMDSDSLAETCMAESMTNVACRLHVEKLRGADRTGPLHEVVKWKRAHKTRDPVLFCERVKVLVRHTQRDSSSGFVIYSDRFNVGVSFCVSVQEQQLLLLVIFT